MNLTGLEVLSAVHIQPSSCGTTVVLSGVSMGCDVTSCSAVRPCSHTHHLQLRPQCTEALHSLTMWSVGHVC